MANRKQYEPLDQKVLEAYCEVRTLPKQDTAEGMITALLAQDEADRIQDDKWRAEISARDAACTAASAFPATATPGRRDWAEDAQAEADATAKAKAVAKIEVEEGWGTVSNLNKRSLHPKKVDEEAGGSQTPVVIQEKERTAKLLTTITTDQSVIKTKKEARAPPGVEAGKVKEDKTTPPTATVGTNPASEAKKTTGGSQNVETATEPSANPMITPMTASFGDVAENIKHAATTSNVPKRAAPQDWDDYIDRMPVAFKPLRLAPEIISSASSSAAAPSYTTAASPDVDDSEVTTDTELDIVEVTQGKKDKAPAGSEIVPETPTKDKKKPSGAQRRKAKKAEAAAESSANAPAKPTFVNAADIGDLQPVVCNDEKITEPDLSSSSPVTELEIVNEKAVEDIPASTPEQKIKPTLTPVETIIEQAPMNVGKVVGVAETLAKFGYVQRAATTATSEAVSAALQPPMSPATMANEASAPTEDLDGLHGASVEVTIEPKGDGIIPALSNQELQPLQSHTQKVLTGSSNVDENIVTILTDEGDASDAGNDADPVVTRKKTRTRAQRRAAKERAVAATVAVVEEKEMAGAKAGDKEENTAGVPVPTPNKKNKPSGAQRREAKGAAAVGASVPVVPAVLHAPAAAAPPVGIRVGNHNVPWFILLAIFMAQLIVVAISLHQFV